MTRRCGVEKTGDTHFHSLTQVCSANCIGENDPDLNNCGCLSSPNAFAFGGAAVNFLCVPGTQRKPVLSFSQARNYSSADETALLTLVSPFGELLLRQDEGLDNDKLIKQ